MEEFLEVNGRQLFVRVICNSFGRMRIFIVCAMIDYIIHFMEDRAISAVD